VCLLVRLAFGLRRFIGRLVAIGPDRVSLRRISLGSIDLGRIGLARICRGSFGLGGIPRRIFVRGITGGRLLGFRWLFNDGLAASALLLPGARFAVGSGLYRSLPFGRRVRPCEPLRIAARARALALRRSSVGVRLGSLLRRSGHWQPATKPVGPIWPSVLLGVLLRLILALIPGVGSAVGYQVGREYRGHVGAGRIVLAQKTRQ